MNVTLIDEDLLEQDIDVIVNVWHRTIIPWWLLQPQGVSGAIKKRGGFNRFGNSDEWGRLYSATPLKRLRGLCHSRRSTMSPGSKCLDGPRNARFVILSKTPSRSPGIAATPRWPFR